MLFNQYGVIFTYGIVCFSGARKHKECEISSLLLNGLVYAACGKLFSKCSLKAYVCLHLWGGRDNVCELMFLRLDQGLAKVG